ncbi:MAG: hypothetical protein AAGA81_07600 [Acidobacteriota bacterium]
MEESRELPPDLLQRLRDAGPKELHELLDSYGDALDAPSALHVLRNPHCDRQVTELLLDRNHLLRVYEVRRDLVLHRNTPEVQAVRQVPSLFWRDLARAASDVRVRPRIRRAAEQTLGQRLPGLSLGEKVSLARVASGLLLSQLRWDPHPKVLEALLDNPRLTEGTLVPLVAKESTSGRVLTLIARNRKWGSRYEIKRSLCRNPRTPPALALALLPSLKRNDIRAVALKPGIVEAVRRKARELVGM